MRRVPYYIKVHREKTQLSGAIIDSWVSCVSSGPVSDAEWRGRRGRLTALALGACEAQGAVAAAGELGDLALHQRAVHIVAALEHHLQETQAAFQLPALERIEHSRRQAGDITDATTEDGRRAPDTVLST